MPTFREQFEYYHLPDEDAVKTAIRTGMIVPDTNVLLNLYRFQSTARDELFGALEKTGDRLWVPHQVGYEFHENRLKVLRDQEQFFAKTSQEFGKLVADIQRKTGEFLTRISMDKSHGEDAGKKAGDLLASLKAMVDSAASGSVKLDDHASDSVLARLEAMIGTRIGAPFEGEELQEARKEAERRAELSLPPGFMDADKPDPCGDYFVFRQMTGEARARQLPVVFITDDRKKDWWRREQNLTLGARRELREEMQREAGVPLLMMTTATFLRHAEKYLDVVVSAETVDQADRENTVPEPPGARLRRAFTAEMLKRVANSPDASDLRIEELGRRVQQAADWLNSLSDVQVAQFICYPGESRASFRSRAMAHLRNLNPGASAARAALTQLVRDQVGGDLDFSVMVPPYDVLHFFMLLDDGAGRAGQVTETGGPGGPDAYFHGPGGPALRYEGDSRDGAGSAGEGGQEPGSGWRLAASLEVMAEALRRVRAEAGLDD